MAKRTISNVKLGIFVIAGLSFLVLLLYVIGKNQNLFGKTFMLKARFEDVRGLMPGNNIRFAGIDAGTVKSVQMINDTTIEVTLLIKKGMKEHIHKNATVSIGTDGVMGNKLLKIESAKAPAPVVEEGDILYSSSKPDTEDIIKTLNTTTNDVAFIAKELKQTVLRINSSKAIWAILNDETLPSNLRSSLVKIRNASENMNAMMVNLDEIVQDVRNGKGSVGELLKDTSIADNVKESFEKIKKAGLTADTISAQINTLVSSISNDINSGNGTVNVLLKDKGMAENLNNTIKNIEQGTHGFNENMEAIKHSFLFRGYFKKLERRKKLQNDTSLNLK